MSFKNLSKTEQATVHTQDATALFTTAHAKLNTAVDLYAEAEKEHSELAKAHTVKAQQAKSESARAQRVRDRLAELVA